MEEIYHPKDIETNAQKYWDENKLFHVDEHSEKEKFYCLFMFPYPSGKLHAGHVRNYAISDAIARFQKMKGKNVLHPIGWDAFGLPAESAAIKNKTAPAKWTYENIESMKKQLISLGFALDWSREIKTCDPEYYKWEQWFFTKLYEKGLVYRKNSPVNWCPNDQTVLANEQVQDGKCWRCDTPVENKFLPQWFVKVTAYAEELLQELDNLDGWPEQVKAMQRNWIGKSKGIEIKFKIKNSPEHTDNTLTIFTTRPDTLMGVTYLAISPEHILSKIAAQKANSVSSFIQECQQGDISEENISTIDAKGINTGFKAEHPITGESIPIWIANFVLMSYGTGAVMAVPAHDQRDWSFAHFYNLPIKQVISIKNNSVDISKEAITEKGILINSEEFTGLDSDQAFDAIGNWLEQNAKGEHKVNYRLRDWGVSRQRYWGTPIPINYLEDGEAVAVSENQLPVILPENVIMNGASSPLKTDSNWSKTQHKGSTAARETDTFDTFMESSWYYARYCSPHEKTQMLDSKKANYWLPVDQYIGGIEHACMHLLYARFFHKLLRDFDFVNSNEPFKRLLCQGMVLADSFYYEDDIKTKHWVSPQQVKLERNSKGEIVNATCSVSQRKLKHAGMVKMSKSKNNGIDPQEMIEKYGADTVRLYSLFAAPPEQTLEWSSASVEGAFRFHKRLWKIVFDHYKNIKNIDSFIKIPDKLNTTQKSFYRKIHQTIEKVSDDFDRRQTFNTAIASLMELLNAITKFDDKSDTGVLITHQAIKSLLLMLSPVSPHICHALWKYLKTNTCISDEIWPKADKDALVTDSITLVIQVNGKVRAKIQVGSNSDNKEIENLALTHDNVTKFIEGKEVRKIIIVPGKLVSIVAN